MTTKSIVTILPVADSEMKTFEYDPYLKIIVLQIDDFSSSIIDERNFSMDNKTEIMKFKHSYMRRDDCYIVEIMM